MYTRFSGYIGVLMLALTSCHGSNSGTDDFNIPLYEPEYASGFRIDGADGMKSTMITVDNPWQSADSVRMHLFIARDGEKIPEGDNIQVLEGDAKRIVAMSSTHIAMLDALGKAENVVGVSGIDYITNPTVQAHRDSIGDIGFEGNINYELLLALDPDIVLLYGVNGASSMEGKLKELGIPFMYVGDYLEESPLGKAEWLVAISEITGNRHEGEKIFKEIPEHYKELKGLVVHEASSKPKVMINTPYNDTWFMPSSKSYAVQLIQDAGGDFIYHQDSGNESVAIDLEKAYELASQADIWLNPGRATSLEEVRSMVPKFADTPPFRNGMIFNNNLRTTAAGGNDYYESAVVHPDIVLRDLIKIFHPELVAEEFVYHQKLK